MRGLQRKGYGRLAAAILLGLVGPMVIHAETFASSAFEELWQRTDKLVQAGRVARTWTWGPQPGFTTMEPYTEGPDGQRLVQYFDKSRMEINDPTAPRNQWYVTNGLLVREMVSGQIQVGNSTFMPKAAPQIPVAGDMTNNPDMPTYAAFGACEPSLQDGIRAYKLLGEPVTAIWTVRECPNGVDIQKAKQYPETAIESYDEVTGHNIPGVFWRYLQRGGIIWDAGRQVQTTPLFDGLYVVGRPLTAAYWTSCAIGGQKHDVLVQLFERRVLTYTPANPRGWQVEMGNVGQHYRMWRYDRT